MGKRGRTGGAAAASRSVRQQKPKGRTPSKSQTARLSQSRTSSGSTTSLGSPSNGHQRPKAHDELPKVHHERKKEMKAGASALFDKTVTTVTQARSPKSGHLMKIKRAMSRSSIITSDGALSPSGASSPRGSPPPNNDKDPSVDTQSESPHGEATFASSLEHAALNIAKASQHAAHSINQALHITQASQQAAHAIVHAYLKTMDGVSEGLEMVKSLFGDVFAAFHGHYLDAVYVAEVVAEGFVQQDEIEVGYLDSFGERFGCRKFGLRFDVLIMLVVVGNAVVLTIDTNDHEGEHLAFCNAASYFFASIFIFEFIIRIAAMKRVYFRYSHNWLDFIITFLAVLDTFIFTDDEARFASVLRVMRLLRIIRLVKVARRIRPVWTLMRSMYAALAPLLSALLLLLLSLFAFGVFTTQIVGQSPELKAKIAELSYEEEQEFDVDESFGTVAASMLTLFGCVTDGCHDDVFVPLVLAEPLLAIPILAFVMLIAIGLMNVLVGIFCESSCRVSSEFDKMLNIYQDTVQRKSFFQLARLWVLADTECKGLIDESQLQDVCRTDEGSCLLYELGVYEMEVGDLFRTADIDGDGYASMEDFMNVMEDMRHLGDNPLSTYLTMRRVDYLQHKFEDQILGFEQRIKRILQQVERDFMKRVHTLQERINVAQASKRVPRKVDKETAVLLAEMHTWMQTAKSKSRSLKSPQPKQDSKTLASIADD
eukprot:gnl/MRDRNA2_/MRDRNA2_34798_c0_seq1.p1 gnl/MRDRNA2_/MRDRNA2_34798_c0~~gnl/MRDRNA2_/MRDRNA2_34798_c0_seq1.p1  ORF type:complete len:712 (+),score=109.67 gnl/MRDRNA2_/MRDRNA2_34798_c0_seq1:60-2195(+)